MKLHVKSDAQKVNELKRVRITKGKMNTANVQRESRGNRFWFELARGLSLREIEFTVYRESGFYDLFPFWSKVVYLQMFSRDKK